jgi:hypothetical protein
MKKRFFVFFIAAAGILLGACADTTGPRVAAPQRMVQPNTTMQDPCAAVGYPGPQCDGIMLSRSAADWSICAVSHAVDADHDNVDDNCEYLVAQAFAPSLRLSATEPNGSRQSYWAVTIDDRPGTEQSLRIFYMFAYNHDESHDGDSEFAQLRIWFDESATYGGTNGRWKLVSATYSAHFGELNDYTTDYGYSDLGYDFGGPFRGAPVDFVSRGKHANYAHKEDCGGVFHPADDCTDNTVQVRFDVLTDRNIGSSRYPFRNCVQSVEPTVYLGIECLWTGTHFVGWVDGSTASTTGYRTLLDYYGWIN